MLRLLRMRRHGTDRLRQRIGVRGAIANAGMCLGDARGRDHLLGLEIFFMP